MGAFIFLASLCLLCTVVQFSTAREFKTCDRYYSKMGCVREDKTKMILLVNDRSIIDWYKFPETLHSLSCTCSQKARAAGYKYFSIRFWAECWVGKDLAAIKNVLKDDSHKANTCLGGDYKPCNHGAAGECAGTDMVEYVYLVEPPVDGGLSKWAPWSKCDKPCGGGLTMRTRQCNNPAPKYGGKDCTGILSQKKACNTQGCPVNGGLSKWTKWSTCDKSCGGGSTMRSRQCNNPPPKNGGLDCTGTLIEKKPCNNQACPVDGGVSPWAGWTGCSKSCDWGTKTRRRTCTNPAPANGGKPCSEPLTETGKCYLRKCGCSNSYRYLGRNKGCGPAYTHQGTRCDGWQRMSLSRCKQMCNQNAAPGGCSRQKCHFVIWAQNPGTPPGWCQLGSNNCREYRGNSRHHLYARNC